MKTISNYTIIEILPIIGIVAQLLLLFNIFPLDFKDQIEEFRIYIEKIESDFFTFLLMYLLLLSPFLISIIITHIFKSKVESLKKIERKKDLFETDNIVTLSTTEKIQYETEVLNLINSKLSYGELSKFDSATEYKISVDYFGFLGPFILVDCIVDTELLMTSKFNPKSATINTFKEEEKGNQLLTITGGVIVEKYPNKKIEYPSRKIRIVLFKSDEDIVILKKAMLNLIKIINAPYRDS